jgi:hypothetical protein
LFRIYLQLICLPFVLLAITYKENINGRWDWIKSYQETEAGGHYITPNDLGYSMHMIIRNDSAYTYHNDTLVKSGSTQSLVHETIHSDTLTIQEFFAIDAQRISYWKKATTKTIIGTIRQLTTTNKNAGKEKINVLGRQLIQINHRKKHIENMHARSIRIL